MGKTTRFLTVSAVALMAPISVALSDNSNDAETLRQMELFAEVFTIVRDGYVEDIEDSELMEGAINGALDTLDPHSSYVPKEDHAKRQKSARREYGGLGIEVVMEDELVKVNYVIPGGPADKSGLKRGDLITAVEGDQVKGKTLSEAVDGMRGLAGDPITITVKSTNNVIRDVVVVRETVSGRAVRHRIEEGLGYIYIESFNHPRLDRDVKSALEELKSELGGSLPGLIIDVRSNPGGRVDQVVKVTSNFLDGGEVFSSRGREASDTQRYHADDGELFPNVPIIVLINSQSASAAEIIAGALQDRNRALVLGRRSFGKGSVQSIMQVSEGGALRLTTERYFTPSGNSIQSRGIMPDILVAGRVDSEETRKRFRESDLENALANPDDMKIDEDYDKMEFPPEDWPDGEDFQLSKAVEMLKTPDYKSKLAQKNRLGQR